MSELVRQVSRDSVVKTRYARHFHVGSSQVVAALGRLRLITLKHPLRTRSWYIGKDGGVHVKTKLLPKGTPVFASTDGKPLLSWSCGNPLSSQLPRKAVTTAKTKSAAPVEEAPVETKVLAAQPETVGAPPLVPEPVMAGPVAPLPLAEAPLMAMAPPIMAAPSIASVGSAFNALPALGGLAGLFAGVAAVGFDTSDRKEPEFPVPEPMGIAVVITGIAAMRFRRR